MAQQQQRPPQPQIQQQHDGYFELLNNKNMSVILQKKNFFKLNPSPSLDTSKLLNRNCVFSVTYLDAVTSQPTVSPLRVGVIHADGIKLRHDF